MERISSRQNAIVKRFRDLARAARPVTTEADPSARGDVTALGGHAVDVLLDGEHLVQEALLCDIRVEIAAFSEKQLTNVLSPVARIAKAVKKRGGRVLVVSDQVLAAMSPVQHPSGVVAIARARPSDVRVVMAKVTDLPLVLVLAGRPAAPHPPAPPRPPPPPPPPRAVPPPAARRPPPPPGL